MFPNTIVTRSNRATLSPTSSGFSKRRVCPQRSDFMICATAPPACCSLRAFNCAPSWNCSGTAASPSLPTPIRTSCRQSWPIWRPRWMRSWAGDARRISIPRGDHCRRQAGLGMAERLDSRLGGCPGPPRLLLLEAQAHRTQPSLATPPRSLPAPVLFVLLHEFTHLHFPLLDHGRRFDQLHSIAWGPLNGNEALLPFTRPMLEEERLLLRLKIRYLSTENRKLHKRLRELEPQRPRPPATPVLTSDPENTRSSPRTRTALPRSRRVGMPSISASPACHPSPAASRPEYSLPEIPLPLGSLAFRNARPRHTNALCALFSSRPDSSQCPSPLQGLKGENGPIASPPTTYFSSALTPHVDGLRTLFRCFGLTPSIDTSHRVLRWTIHTLVE